MKSPRAKRYSLLWVLALEVLGAFLFSDLAGAETVHAEPGLTPSHLRPLAQPPQSASSPPPSEQQDPRTVALHGDPATPPAASPTVTAGPAAPPASAMDGARHDAQPRRRCVTGTNLRQGEPWEWNYVRWREETDEVFNGLSSVNPVAHVRFQEVEIEFHCIANTQGGVTSCGIEANVLRGRQAPEIEKTIWGPDPYYTASRVTPLTVAYGGSNGVATIHVSFAKGVAMNAFITPTIGVGGGGAAVGLIFNHAGYQMQRIYQRQESCQAIGP